MDENVPDKDKIKRPKCPAAASYAVCILLSPVYHLCTRHRVNHVLELSLCTTILPADWDDRNIGESLAVANYVEVESAIDVLCEWIARETNSCADIDVFRAKFHLGSVAGQLVHPAGSLFSYSTDEFWLVSLFPLLSNDQQDIMSATCTLTQKNDRVSKLYTFQSKTLGDRKKQIKAALRHMQMVRTRAEGIATQWVQAMTFSILGGHTRESL